MDASQVKQITRAAPVWVWDGNWWPAVVADAERGGFLIVRLENGVTVPAQKARLQLRDPTAPTSPDVPAARASRAVWRGCVIGQESLPTRDGGWRRRTI
jgi:hypothetical protein